LTTFDPDVIILGEKVKMKITGGLFLNTTITVKFVGTVNDPYNLNRCGYNVSVLPDNCTIIDAVVWCNGNNVTNVTANVTLVPCPTIVDIDTTKVEFISANEITFENVATSKIALYNLYISFNNISYQTTSKRLITYGNNISLTIFRPLVV
jgi:hypothetical protein